MKSRLSKIENAYGVEYISEKKENRSFMLFLLILFTTYYFYFIHKTYLLGILNINEVQILLFLVYLFLFVMYLDNHFIEKLVLINNIGIQIEKYSLFHKSIKFVCADDLKNVFIHEAIYIFEICPYLCISLKDNKLIVIFEDFILGLNELVNVYREIKETFFYVQTKLLQNIKAMNIEYDDPEFSDKASFLNVYKKLDDDCSSSDEINIFQMLASTYNEQLKGGFNDNEKELKPKEVIYDVYIDKKKALEIMNE